LDQKHVTIQRLEGRLGLDIAFAVVTCIYPPCLTIWVKEKADLLAFGIIAPETSEAAKLPSCCATATAEMTNLIATSEFAEDGPIAADWTVALLPIAKV